MTEYENFISLRLPTLGYSFRIPTVKYFNYGVHFSTENATETWPPEILGISACDPALRVLNKELGCCAVMVDP
jgi:hypothetical protein